MKSLTIRKSKGLRADALDRRPKRTLISEWYIRSFFTLRSSAGRLGPPKIFEPELKPITLSEIKAYVDMFGVISTLREFVSTIQALDKIYILQMEKLRNARKQSDNSNRRGGRRSIGKGIN